MAAMADDARLMAMERMPSLPRTSSWQVHGGVDCNCIVLYNIDIGQNFGRLAVDFAKQEMKKAG